MNALVGSIRARVKHGYHMTRKGQAIEDVKDLLELVDRLVQSHWPCIKDEMTNDCVADIAEELGVARPSQT